MPAPSSYTPSRRGWSAAAVVFALSKAGRQTLGVVAAAVLVCTAGALSGCVLPSDCGDLDYPTYGGAWQRTRRDGGRVGSIFDAAGARSAAVVPRDGADAAQAGRSPRESLYSAPPLRSSEDRDPPMDPDQLPEPSPSDRLDRDRLRALDLDEINLDPGPPAPPDLN
jgi:hypothetical protein